MKGYMGNLLRVNLSSLTYSIEKIDEKILRQYVGGCGYATYLLYTELKAGIAPLSPENKLVFATSPLSANNVPGGGSVMVCFKSPATGGWGQARCGGNFGPTLRKASFDFLVIEGKAEKPVYIEIFNDKISFKDATVLLDKNVEERDRYVTENMPKEAKNPSAMTIGIAGDKMVKFASVMCKDRAAGRGGGGAVMGSKNLLAIVVSGSTPFEHADKKEFIKSVKEVMSVILDENTETRDCFFEYGTTGDMGATWEGGDLPTKNWRSNSWEAGPELFDHFQEKNLIKASPCYSGCPVSCARVCKVDDGLYKTPEHVGGEYETVAAMSAFTMSKDMDAAVHCGYLCNLYGLDTISTGGVLAFAMDCFEHGVIGLKDTDNLEFSFGSTSSMPEMIRKIAYREGIGNILAEGVKVASEKLGEKSKPFAIHVKGLEGPAHDARASKALALNYATASRGMCHIQPMDGVSFDKGKASFGMVKYGASDPNLIERYDEKGRGKDVAIMQRGHSICDILSTCKFMTYAGLTLVDYAKMLANSTGWNVTDDELYKVGERVINLQRMFNIREGFSRKDDVLPKRLLTLPETGPFKNTQECVVQNFNALLTEYYKANGWDTETGRPTDEKLSELDLLEITKQY